MYTCILDLVLFNKQTNFTQIVNISFTNLTDKIQSLFIPKEGFTGEIYKCYSCLINAIIIITFVIILYYWKNYYL